MGMYDEYCLWAQVAVLLLLGLYCTVWDRYMQILYLGRAPHTKETLPNFREKCRVTRHSRVFRGLKGSQRTPGIWGVTPPTETVINAEPETQPELEELVEVAYFRNRKSKDIQCILRKMIQLP